MSEHFEDLWNKSEAESKESDLNEVLDKLLLKVQTYNMIHKNGSIVSKDELYNSKVRFMGEIILTLTHLSAIENIDVYASLKQALKIYIENNLDIPKDLRLP